MTAPSSRPAVPDDVLAIGIGGNVGEEAAIRARFERAREALTALGELRSAALYRTAPIGPLQPRYLNTAVRVRICDATAAELITTVLELERLLGRERRTEVRWGPRTIDLDLLVWGSRTLRTPELELPHPRLAERRFVLRPLVDLFGEEVVLPGPRDSIGMLERRVHAQAIEEISATW